MIGFKEIIINKNRGWRGLAELIIRDATHSEQARVVFSFSQEVWNDLLKGNIVYQDDDYYYVMTIDNLDKLPKPTQQRSVLIKNFFGNITNVNRYNKTLWSKYACLTDWNCISNFIKNKNNHTQSDWNCIRNTCCPIYIN